MASFYLFRYPIGGILVWAKFHDSRLKNISFQVSSPDGCIFLTTAVFLYDYVSFN